MKGSRCKLLAGFLGLLTITAVCRASAADEAVLPRLAGTFVAPTDRRALVQVQVQVQVQVHKTPGYVAVEIGDKLETWTVEAIEAGSIRLVGANGRVELTLSDTGPLDQASDQDASGARSSWTHPCGRIHALRNTRPLRDTGACVRAAMVGNVSS